MRVRALTSTGDYFFGNGQLCFYIDSPAGVGQTVKTRLLLFLGEWYLNIIEGTPYFQGVLGKYSQAQADAVIQARILDTDNVTSLTNYVSTLDETNRALSITCSIDTAFGATTVQIANYTLY